MCAFLSIQQRTDKLAEFSHNPQANTTIELRADSLMNRLAVKQECKKTVPFSLDFTLAFVASS
jgi:hypothetical protein